MSRMKDTLDQIDSSVAELKATGLITPNENEFREAVEIVLLGEPDKALKMMYEAMGMWERPAWKILSRSFKMPEYTFLSNLYYK